MVVRYDTLDRLEKPVMTLCNPGAQYQNGKLTNAICCLFDTEAEEFVGNFNSISELNFRVNRVEYEDIDKDNAALRMYSSIKNRRMIFVEDIGFFVITNVEEKIENEIKYKDVSAGSVDTELQQRMLPYIPDGTYRFSTDGADIGIMDTIVSTLALWQIGHVDNAVATRHRTFESVETNQNCLSFMIDKMQEAYECIILFDPIYRLINVYDQDTYTSNQDIQTDIHISTDDIVNSVTVTEGSEDLYTAIRVFGGDNDNVYISCVNPTGQNVIYDFSYYYDWMSDGLRGELISWAADVADAETTYKEKNIALNNLEDERDVLIEDMKVILANIDICERTLGNIKDASKASLKVSEEDLKAIVYGGEPLYETSIDVDTQDYEDLKNAIETDLQALAAARTTILNAIEAKQSQIDAKTEEIQAIITALDLSARLSSDEYAELQNYIFEGEYKDEYALITDKMTNADKFEQREQMYERAKKQLARTSHPTQEFSIDTDGFVFAKVFSKFTDKLETGRIINIGIDELYSQTSMFFLSTIEINFDDKKMSLTIGNRYNKFDPRSLFENVLGSVSRSANTISYLKDVVYPLKAGEIDEVKEALQNVRNITMANAIAAEDQSVIIDSTGYTGRRSDGEGGFDPEQVKIVNNSIVFTDDAWDTCRTALGKMTIPDPEHPGQNMTVYGLIADAIIGNLVLSQNVTVKNDDSSIVLNDDGITFDGTNVTAKVDTGGVLVTENTDLRPSSSIIDFFTRLFNYIKNIFSTSSGGLFNKVGVKVYNSRTNNESILASNILGFKDGSKQDPDDQTAYTYYGLDGAKTPKLRSDYIFTNEIVATDIKSEIIQHYPDSNKNIIYTNCPLNGYVTSSGTLINLALPLDKLFIHEDYRQYLDRIIVNSATFSTRGVNGYIGFITNQGGDVIKPDGNNNYRLTWSSQSAPDYMEFSINQQPCSENMLLLQIKDMYGFSNVPNNTPVSVFFNSLSFKFTADFGG